MDKSQFISGVCDIYDTRLLKNSLTTEGNVVGILLSDLTLFDDCGLENKDFVTVHGRMLFTLGQQLRNKGLSNFDEITFISNANEELRDKIQNELGGFKSIQNVIDAVSVKNMDAYIDELNKRNILMSLYRKNFNIFEEMTLDNGKKVVPYSLFEKMSSSEVLDWYESQVTTLTKKINSSKIVEEGYVDFDDSFLESLTNQEELGLDFGNAGQNIKNETIHTFEFLSRQLMGLRHGTLSAFAAASGVGKSTWLVGLLMSLVAGEDNNHKVCLVSNESVIKDIKIQFLAWFCARYLDEWKITKTKLISGNLTNDEKQIIQKAKKCFREKFAKKIKLVTLADADSHLTCQILKNAILRDGVDIICVDTFKLSMDNRSENFWLSLVSDTRALAELCLKYNVIGLMTVQLAINSQNRSFLTAECLSQSKAIKEVLSNLVLIRQAYPSLEFSPESPYYIKPFRSKQNEKGEWVEDAYLPDPTKTWRVIFVDKARRGITSGDNGIAYLSRFDAEHASFFETAKCYPTHKVFNAETK